MKIQLQLATDITFIHTLHQLFYHWLTEQLWAKVNCSTHTYIHTHTDTNVYIQRHAYNTYSSDYLLGKITREFRQANCKCTSSSCTRNCSRKSTRGQKQLVYYFSHLIWEKATREIHTFTVWTHDYYTFMVNKIVNALHALYVLVFVSFFLLLWCVCSFRIIEWRRRRRQLKEKTTTRYNRKEKFTSITHKTARTKRRGQWKRNKIDSQMYQKTKQNRSLTKHTRKKTRQRRKKRKKRYTNCKVKDSSTIAWVDQSKLKNRIQNRHLVQTESKSEIFILFFQYKEYTHFHLENREEKEWNRERVQVWQWDLQKEKKTEQKTVLLCIFSVTTRKMVQVSWSINQWPERRVGEREREEIKKKEEEDEEKLFAPSPFWVTRKE